MGLSGLTYLMVIWILTRANGQMLTFSEMLARADICDDQADRVSDPIVEWMLRGAAQRWRTIAVQMDLLEREPLYRRLRARGSWRLE
jgi:hypothetical protein